MIKKAPAKADKAQAKLKIKGSPEKVVAAIKKLAKGK